MGDMHMECALATRACPRDLSSLRVDTTPADPLRALMRGVPSCLGVVSHGAVNGLAPPAPAVGTDAGFGSPSPEVRAAVETVDDEDSCRSRAETLAHHRSTAAERNFVAFSSSVKYCVCRARDFSARDGVSDVLVFEPATPAREFRVQVLPQ